MTGTSLKKQLIAHVKRWRWDMHVREKFATVKYCVVDSSQTPCRASFREVVVPFSKRLNPESVLSIY